MGRVGVNIRKNSKGTEVIDVTIGDKKCAVKRVSGRGRYSGLKWWSIEVAPGTLNLKDEFENYTHILLLPYRIDCKGIEKFGCVKDCASKHKLVKINVEENKNESGKKVYNPYWGEEKINIDPNTGNIHVTDKIDDPNDIRQVALCRKSGQIGPLMLQVDIVKFNSEIQKIEEVLGVHLKYPCFIFRRSNEKQKKYQYRIIPKDCHFPRIECTGNIQQTGPNKEANRIAELIEGLLAQVEKKAGDVEN